MPDSIESAKVGPILGRSGQKPSVGFIGGQKPRLVLEFHASMTSSPFTEIFMQTGGPLESMAVRWESDVSLTGSKSSTVVRFSETETVPVSVDVPTESVTFESEQRVLLPSDMCINVMHQRVVAAINGTLATSVSGESSDYLFHALSAGSHYQIGQHYKTFQEFSDVMAISDMQLVKVDADGSRTRVQPSFKARDEQKTKTLGIAAKLVEEYAKAGYGMRQALVYQDAPMLHKTVYSEIVGINSSGYNLLHNITNRELCVSLETLNALYQAAVSCELCQSERDVGKFLQRTEKPSLDAAVYADIVASATSLIVSFLMSYRADGVNVVTPQGVAFMPIENWNGSVPRSALEVNDCDGLALLSISLIKSTLKLTPEQLVKPEYEYLRAVRNAIFPHYQIALSVIGASAAEATSADNTHSAVAGHAITVLVPTMSFLRALSKAMGKRVGKDGCMTSTPEIVNTVNKLRFDALYPMDTMKQLPSDEASLLRDWDTAQNAFGQLKAYAIEGTTPASSVLYVSNPERRAKAAKAAALDKEVFARAAPNAFRSVKVMHVGGRSANSSHTFYSSLVELTFDDEFPLYVSAGLRQLGFAASQFVLTPEPTHEEITEAGVNPQELVMEEYGAVPLVVLNGEVARALDTASKIARLDLMPPREVGPTRLTEFQSKSLKTSMEHVAELDRHLKEITQQRNDGDEANEHCVAYICAFNTLVHNPRAVHAFVKTMKRVAVSGGVDMMQIPGLAVDHESNQAGVFVYVNISAPV